MFSQNGSAVTLTIGPDSLHLVNDSTIQSLQDSLAQHFAMTIEVTVEQGLPEQTPLLIQRRINAIRTAHAQTLFANDPNMQALTATFGANDAIAELLISYLSSWYPEMGLTSTDFPQRWSGIIAQGNGKTPVLRHTEEGVLVAGRLAGMGVALSAALAARAVALLR